MKQETLSKANELTSLIRNAQEQLDCFSKQKATSRHYSNNGRLQKTMEDAYLRYIRDIQHELRDLIEQAKKELDDL